MVKPVTSTQVLCHPWDDRQRYLGPNIFTHPSVAGPLCSCVCVGSVKFLGRAKLGKRH